MLTTQNTQAISQVFPMKDVILSIDGGTHDIFKNLNVIHLNSGETKSISVARDETGNWSDIVQEGQDANKMKIKYEEIILKPKRFAEAVEVPNQFVQDSIVDTMKYALKIGTERMLKAREHQIAFLGFGATSTPEEKATLFEKLVSDTNATAQTKEGEPLLYSDVLSTYRSMKQAKRTNGAFWLINNSAEFSVLDAHENERLSFANTLNGAEAILFGLPVYMCDLTDRNGNPVAFALVHPDAYATCLSDAKVTRTNASTVQAINGTQMYVVELWSDGKLTDRYAKYSMSFAPEVQQASVTEQSIVEPKPVKRKATKIEKE
ncbi:TPA: phage major capsid protein [Bacillus cereus]